MGRVESITPAAERGASPFSDLEVVARVKAGDTALFEVLMRRYNQRLYRVARSILGSDAEAEDVMQEAYVRAYRHLDQFEGRSSFSTWLTKIAVYEALARARRSARFETLESLPESEEQHVAAFVSESRDPERRMFDQEVKTLLEKSIDRLPRDYRSVFALREIEGMDTAETAECLGVSVEVVKTRLHRARALIREDLYRQAGATSAAAFEFHLSRCDRIVDAVLRRIA
ncbi:MAG TPA: RNA polymerase sigma factor [Candidatus Polarisedimenticolia bacterium]|nr:RNA polymerase sigma factor [Candidatus Polarisedimenticolia bacterium]